MPEQAKFLLSAAVPPLGWLFGAPLLAFAIEMDNATAMAIASAVVWVYFEIRRRSDLKEVKVLSQSLARQTTDMAAAVEHRTAAIEAKVDANAAAIATTPAPTINVNIKPKVRTDGQETKQADASP